MGNAFYSAYEQRLKSVQVGDVMSRYPVTVEEDISIESAAHILMKFRISGIPVVDSAGALKGVITATDLFNVLHDILVDIDSQKDPTSKFQVRVQDLMAKQVHSVSESQSLYEVAKLMCEKNTYTLPVLRGKEIVGVIGRRDVIHAVYSFRP